jgi:lysophospholipase L1-like esterase
MSRILGANAAFVLAALACCTLGHTTAAQAQVVALGDSNIYGPGVSTAENYPSQLQAALNARGKAVTVTNAGWSGDKTAGVLARVDSAVPNGTKLVVLWVGDNDKRRSSWSEIARSVQDIRARLQARGIAMYRVPLRPSWDLRKDPANVAADGRHLSREGYRKMVALTLPSIERMLR